MAGLGECVTRVWVGGAGRRTSGSARVVTCLLSQLLNKQKYIAIYFSPCLAFSQHNRTPLSRGIARGREIYFCPGGKWSSTYTTNCAEILIVKNRTNKQTNKQRHFPCLNYSKGRNSLWYKYFFRFLLFQISQITSNDLHPECGVGGRGRTCGDWVWKAPLSPPTHPPLGGALLCFCIHYP